ncbi:MAG TPA: ABC transporter permease [Acidimicrobiales bacterium]|nr:ABC transporter permease [Acidimicrobiales bacterium]
MTWRAVLLLARRSVIGRFRHPSLFLPDLVGPILFTLVLWGSFERTTVLPEFPDVRSFLDFALVGAVVVGVCFSATDVSDDLQADIAGGFFDRLAVTPVSRPALVLGRLAGAAAFAGFEALAIMGVLTALGATIRGGAAGVAVIALVAMVLAVGTGGMGANLALRRGIAERAAAMFVPFAFVAVFLSSAYFPRQLMDGWFRAVAGANPVSWVVEDLRHQVVVGFDPATAARAAAMVGVLAAAGVACAVRAVRVRETAA